MKTIILLFISTLSVFGKVFTDYKKDTVYYDASVGLGSVISDDKEYVALSPYSIFTFAQIKSDTNVVAIYDIDSVTNVTGGLIYWDLKTGRTTYAAERNSGYTIPYEVYVITATQANFFFTGCQVGDYYVGLESSLKTLSANNKVKRVLGNHLTQGVDAAKPINGVFDATNTQWMRTVPFTYNQPEMVFFVGKAITWTANDRFFGGNASNGGDLFQKTSTPNICIDAFGGIIGNTSWTLDTLGIVRACFDGTYGKIIIDNNKLLYGAIGSNNMGGFAIGANGAGSFKSNIKFKGAILRKEVANEDYETGTYNYLTNKYNLNKLDTRNTFDNGKLVIGVDGATDAVDASLPIFLDLGIKATIYAEPDHLENGGNGLMSWTDLLDWKNAGMDIQDHPDSSYTGHTVAYDSAIYAHINYQFTSHGFSAPKHSAYMGNTADANFRTANSKMRLSGRGGAGGYLVNSTYRVEFRKPGTNYQYLLGDNIGAYTYAQFCAKLATAKLVKGAYVAYFHGIDAPLADNGLTEAELRLFKHAADSIGVDIITHDQLYNLMQH